MQQSASMVVVEIHIQELVQDRQIGTGLQNEIVSLYAALI